jgi:selenocysteine-specific elongation factor
LTGSVAKARVASPSPAAGDDRTRLILGSAGHIDHGKTALVKALTGVDCDRLPEEKERGITIELGFAQLELPSGRVLGIVDVPGHERLVRTMVAGATGIDLVLFAVAADEGMMPQSREHLAICDLLGIERGVVALTKVDATDDELVELARLEVAEEREGTSLAGAPIVSTSAKQRIGLDELVAALDDVSAQASPHTLRDGPAWLPVDRVFSMRGFGTVATGTLRGGSLAEDDVVDVLPANSRIPVSARIRGLQVHGESVKRARPGSRCAINLQGLEVSAVPRGSVIATPGRLAYRPRVGVELKLLEGAPVLKSGASVSVHVGTSERSARVLLLEHERLEAGSRGLAELRFDSPLVAVEGDRFILRGFSRIPSAGWTIGGGRILDAEPTRGRRARAERAADLKLAAQGDRAAALSARLRRAGIRGVLSEELLHELRSLEGLEGVRIGDSRWMDPGAFAELVKTVVGAVEAHHRATPTDPWAGFAAIRARVSSHATDPAVRAALDAAAEEGLLRAGSSGYSSPEHRAHVADPELAEQVYQRIAAAGLGPENLDALAQALESDARSLRPVIEHLVRENRIVRVTSDLYFDRAELASLRQKIVDFLEQHGEINPAGYKTLTGQSRKHTVPLMEFFDADKLTIRRDNVRVLRNPRAPADSR